MERKIKINTIPQVRKFCSLSDSYSGEVYVQQGRFVVSGKSFMGMLSLCLMDEMTLFIDDIADDIAEYFEKIDELGIVVKGE